MKITRETYDNSGNLISVEEVYVSDPRPMQAKRALEKSDGVAMRCWKAGIPYPAAWLSHDIACRAIVNGEDLALPDTPDFPEGT